MNKTGGQGYVFMFSVCRVHRYNGYFWREYLRTYTHRSVGYRYVLRSYRTYTEVLSIGIGVHNRISRRIGYGWYVSSSYRRIGAFGKVLRPYRTTSVGQIPRYISMRMYVPNKPTRVSNKPCFVARKQIVGTMATLTYNTNRHTR